MTKAEKLLTEIIRKVIKEEFAQLKVQLLRELKGSNGQLTEMQKKFRTEYEVERKKPVNYSKDPMLNSLLKDTRPIMENEHLEMYDDDLLVTHDSEGRRVNPNNPAFKKINGILSNTAIQERTDLRDKILSRMNDDADEDFTWLQNVK